MSIRVKSAPHYFDYRSIFEASQINANLMSKILLGPFHVSPTIAIWWKDSKFYGNESKKHRQHEKVWKRSLCAFKVSVWDFHTLKHPSDPQLANKRNILQIWGLPTNNQLSVLDQLAVCPERVIYNPVKFTSLEILTNPYYIRMASQLLSAKRPYRKTWFGGNWWPWLALPTW